MGRARRGATGVDSALADLARHKSSGKTSRAAEYSVVEQPSIYDEVDDPTYAEHAARQRAASRAFIEGADGDAAFDSEPEQEDLARPAARSRVHAPKRKRAAARPAAAQPRRVPSAFLAPVAAPAEEPDGPGVFDADTMAREHEELAKRRKAGKRRRRAAAAAAVGDLLFDAADARAVPMDDVMHMGPGDADGLGGGEKAEEKGGDVRGEEEGDGNLTASMVLDSKTAPVAALDATAEVGAMDVDGESPSSLKTYTCPPSQEIKPAASIHVGSAIGAAPTGQQRAEASAVVARAASKASAPDEAPRARSTGPLAREANGDLMLFWTDAHEVRVNGGEHLYLFGKAAVEHADSGVYASVCVLVRGIERALYVLPRHGKSAEEDVFLEISDRVMAGNHAAQQATPHATNLPPGVRAKVVMRQCPFGDADAPRKPTEYLKVKFPYEHANTLLPDSSGSTFSRVYGSKTSASEILCLKRGLKGPGWVRLSGASVYSGRVSHARRTLVVKSPKDISVVPVHEAKPAPPVSALCLSSKTVLNQQSGAHELVMLSGVHVPDVPLECALDASRLDQGAPGTRAFVLLRAPAGKAVPFRFSDFVRSSGSVGDPQVEILQNEGALLNNFMAKMMQLDPDAIVGHDMLGFGLDVLLARMAARRTRQWSCLGRLVQHRDLNSVVKNNASSSWFKADAVAGRLICDTYSSAKEILYKEKDYALSALARNVLGFRQGHPLHLSEACDIDNVPNVFGDRKPLSLLVKECVAEARTAGRLAARLSILPLSKQLTCISGNLWSRTLQGARAQRIEFLLCHEFLRVGSKKGGDKKSSGDITCKLLLPDKLSKAERGKVDALPRKGKPRGPGVTQEPGSKPDDPQGTRNPHAGAAQSANGVPTTNGPAGSTTAKKAKSARRKPQYAGGLVLEPQKGFYDRYVLQLDFNSLYPSIIQEFNICFTTLKLDGGDCITPGTSAVDLSDVPAMQALLPDVEVGVGVLPRVLRALVSQRRIVKMQLKKETNPVMRSQLDIRQTAIKLTANSLYGCLGFEGSRFYAQTLAALVTLQGRDTLEKTVQLVRSDVSNSKVIYGDTDSLFVATGMEDIGKVRELGINLKKQVNSRYKTLEIEIDAIYPKMLLLKKKKYAALKVVNPLRPDVVEREVKGLDLVRHDWCDLSHEASDHFLTQIFRGTKSDIDDAVHAVIQFLEKLSENVRSSSSDDLEKYVITKSLTKDPSLYPDAKSLPHVQVALRLRKLGRRVGAGDYIKYVVCKSTTEDGKSGNSGVSQHAFHPDEVKTSDGKLVVDADYYLDSQVLPPILRLCEPIENVHAAVLAKALGLDGNKYAVRETFKTAREESEDVLPLLVTCARCAFSNEFNGPGFQGSKLKSSGLHCSNCHQRLGEFNIANAMTLHIRKCLTSYYSTPHKLPEDGTQSRTTRMIPLSGLAEGVTREHSETWMHSQLRYLKKIFDVDAKWERSVNGGVYRSAVGSSTSKDNCSTNPLSVGDRAVYRDLLARADQSMRSNGYRLVDLSHFLAPLGV